MNIFKCLDYRDAIKILVDEARKNSIHLNYSKLSKQIGIQNTYMSRVMSKEIHLSADQLYSCCQALSTSTEVCDYLILLLEHMRSNNKDRKKTLYAEILKKRNEKRKIEDHSEAVMVNVENNNDFTAYYLDPRMAVVYVFLMVPEYARDPVKIKNMLSLSSPQFQLILNTLIKLGLIEQLADNKAYRTTTHHLHLPKSSPLSVPAEQLTRLMALEHLKKLTPDQYFSYSLTFAANEETRAYIHDEFLSHLKKFENEIRKAPSEDVYHMNFGLFPWRSS